MPHPIPPVAKLALVALVAASGSGCWWWKAQPEGQVQQDLRVLAPTRTGAAWTMRVEENGRYKGEVIFRELKRVPEGDGFRLQLSRQFRENGELGRPDTAELSQLFSSQALDMRRGWDLQGSPEIEVKGPVRLGMPRPEGERAGRLVAIQPLELPYGRIPWAAAFERRQPQGQGSFEGDRAATAWFAPGMGLVRFDEARPGGPKMQALLTHFSQP